MKTHNHPKNNTAFINIMVDYCKIFCSKLLNCCVIMLTGILCTGQR